jgi:hypothetical protein
MKVYKELGRSVEDIFFYQKDQRLVEAREELRRLQDTKENLARVSGIRNDAVLDKLIELEIRPETLATLFAIPLIEVAWADGDMDDKERQELFRFAEKAGLRQKNINPAVMATWLKRRPDPALLDAWVQYIQALGGQLSAAERQALKSEVMADAHAVAQAAGGVFGFHKESAAEHRVLARLEAAFG